MEFKQMVETLAALPAGEQRQWLLAALGVFAAMALVLMAERSYFKNTRRTGSWVAFRLASVLLAPLTIAAVLVPSLAVSGMEALAVFYAALFIAVPLLWFGGHLLVGRLLRPALTGSECMTLCITGIGILAIPATAFMYAQFPLEQAARNLADQRRKGPDSTPLAHTVSPLRRFAMPGAGVVFAQSLTAPRGVRLERVDVRRNGPWYDTKGTTHALFCSQGDDLHLMWSAGEPAPQLRLHWVQPSGLRAKGEFFADPATAPADTPEFSIAFRPDGFDPVVPIPRVRTYLDILQRDGTIYTDMLNPLQPGETLQDDCLMQGYKRVRWPDEGVVQKVYVTFRLPVGAEALRGVIVRGEGK
ncbi:MULTISPECIES: hypothetical protein [unclassified Polaromonas]|uniref:hypothetical protein n=1 Tax=unclassified Polaromonas TaxID=2638319 RepID=UPI000F08FEB2|nr:MULTISPECIES: hypothetical protein [unclassified Polaromonas]AYQ27804.1 hypothetical protein DT070_07090 [Polaromonas sp. SP1]QGJ17337.1 hypothetical protein F7R28_02330 [Polaromonas sp. Pch-P]